MKTTAEIMGRLSDLREMAKMDERELRGAKKIMASANRGKQWATYEYAQRKVALYEEFLADTKYWIGIAELELMEKAAA